MDIIFYGIIAFLFVLAIFDLSVGVSNDAVNFLNSAIGAKVAKYRTIIIIAATGIFAGAALSNGMMDVARHGIMTPAHFSFYEVMCVFLAVVVTDIVLLDVFNTLGMPTSTTVSMVFELLGGTFAIALLKIIRGETTADGTLLGLGDLLNTEKAISVILSIFLSVAIAFVLGVIVMWISRMVFTFTYRMNGKTTDVKNTKENRLKSSLKTGIFSGISTTAIIWFLLINGLKNSAFMTPEVKEVINENTFLIICGGFVVFSVLMTFLSMFKVPVLKFIVLLGTFALAMAFAGNDLVNFVGVTFAGLDAFQDYMANGDGHAQTYLMQTLMKSAQTPTLFLVLAGVVMVLSLVFSKKAQNVVKTSVDLSRQDEGDEMFGSSGVARVLVRNSSKMAASITSFVPQRINRWIDSRFVSDNAKLPNGAAFDMIRAAVNLVLAGALVAIGTSLKLPLSTTYVTFMVAMGSSLADRAWGRESAVFRITGVLSVIGGWFITAGVAFILCYLVTTAMFFGSYIVMVIAIILVFFLLIHSNRIYNKKQKDTKKDTLVSDIIHSKDEAYNWELLKNHVQQTCEDQLKYVVDSYSQLTTAFFNEEYRPLKNVSLQLSDQTRMLKRQRRREIIALRNIDPILSVEKGTWYFLQNNALAQMVYCLRRMGDPCREHVGNNFTSVESKYANAFLIYRDEIVRLFERACQRDDAELLRNDALKMQGTLSDYRKQIIEDIQKKMLNIESMTVFLNLVQESQELLGSLRHAVRGMKKFEEE